MWFLLQETMKTPFVCMMLVLLFASGFCKVNNFQPSEHRPEETPYEKFRRQHVDAKMTEKLCNTEISNRNVYKIDNSCKETNTFILSIPAKVKSICRGDGRYDENSGMTYSTATFRIIKCKLKHQGARKPSCQYEGRLLTNRIIVVKCEGKLPVHFDRDLLPSESNDGEQLWGKSGVAGGRGLRCCCRWDGCTCAAFAITPRQLKRLCAVWVVGVVDVLAGSPQTDWFTQLWKK